MEKLELPKGTQGIFETEIENNLLSLSEEPDKAISYLMDVYKKHPELTAEVKQKVCLNLYNRLSAKLNGLQEKLDPSQKAQRAKRRTYTDDLDMLEDQLNFLAPHAGIPDREEWKNKDPFVFREKNVEGLKKLLELWHEIIPDYILLTETSAIPYGYAIKEAWKAAYPNENPPEFYRIESWTERAHIVEFGEHVDNDIDTLIENSSPDSPDLPVLRNMKEGVANYFKNRIKKDNAKILMFDQYDKPIEPRMWHEQQRKDGTLFGVGHELHKAYPEAQLYYAGVNGSKLDFGRGGYPISKAHPRVTLKRNVLSIEKTSMLDRPGNRIDPLAVDTKENIKNEILEKGYRPFGRMLKDSERRQEALQYIRNLKEFGQIAGKEFNLK